MHSNLNIIQMYHRSVFYLWKKSTTCTQHILCQKQWKNLSDAARTFATTPGTRPQRVLPPPQELLKPLYVPNKILMGPGPSNCSPRVLAAGALPMMGYLQPEYIQIVDDVKAGLRFAFQTKNEWTFTIDGTGHAAMEATVLNLLEPGEVALVCQNGLWGQRFAAMVELNDSVAKKIFRPMGEVFSLEDVEKGLQKYKPSVVFIVFGESSGGTVQPLEGLGDLCHRYNALLVVDAVAVLGGVPLFMDDAHIDVLYAATQKVLSVPPSISPISFSQRARDKIASRKTKIRSFYFNAPGLADHWGCDNRPTGYHHTEICSSLYMLRESLALLAEEGLENSWKRHKDCAELLYEGLEKLNVELYVKDKTIRNPCVTLVKLPGDMNFNDIRDYIMKKYRMHLAGGLGDLAGKVWRIGNMGYNSTPENMRLLLKAFREALDFVSKK